MGLAAFHPGRPGMCQRAEVSPESHQNKAVGVPDQKQDDIRSILPKGALSRQQEASSPGFQMGVCLHALSRQSVPPPSC